MPVDKSRLLSSLNSSKLQQQNNAAYQVIKGLIDGLQEADVAIRTASSGGGSGGGGSTTVTDSLPQIMLLGLPGKRSVPDNSGSGSSSGFEKELFLGGM